MSAHYLPFKTDRIIKFTHFIFTCSTTLLLMLCVTWHAQAADQVGIWMKFEKDFESSTVYENPLYEVTKFEVYFTSPTGRIKKISGFWDGGKSWKVRFAPDEQGQWTYTTQCSDTTNQGLHHLKGSFECVSHNSQHAIYNKGSIQHPKGTYHLAYADGTPFFWTACTAWNGALKSTDEEWETYLKNRVSNNYNVIQLVTTQWRGGDANIQGQVAFEGSGRIKINPAFFQHLDKKIDKINEYGLVAAPVLLWALPTGRGRHLSPGYYLPDDEAILLARYMVARYGGNQVVWFLGGDGRYINEYEQRWKNIGRGVFGEEHPGIVAQHPHGRSWIGNDYIGEDWLDIIGYQSSHSAAEGTVNWINKGPVAEEWSRIPPRPIINLEPIYEEIREHMTAQDVRNACYWSVFSAPVSGITYGANGIWPWLREGEKILNHGDAPWTSTWRESLALPGSMQVGYLSAFMQQLEWWKLKPAHEELLVEQPGDEVFNRFISVVKTEDYKTVLAYVPVKSTFQLYNPQRIQYTIQWFDPAANRYTDPEVMGDKRGILEFTSPGEQDMVLILQKWQ